MAGFFPMPKPTTSGRDGRFSNGQADAAGSPRNALLFLLGLSVLINYIDRSNLSIAAPLLKSELGISNTQLGTLLSAFFWTYALMQMPAGWLVDRFDVKWVFAAGFFLWSTATGVTSWLHGFTALLIIRVILGIGESVAFPAYSKILRTHFPEGRRGFANGTLMFGLALGPAIGLSLGGRIVGQFGWRPFFLALGFLGLFWLLPWAAYMPRRSPPANPPPLPWSGLLPILRQRSAWGTCLGQFCVNYYLYFLVTWLPSYLIQGRGLSMNGMARDGGLLFLMSALGSLLTGKISDRLIRTGSSPTGVRKGSMGIGCTGFGLALVLTAIAPDSLFTWTMIPTGLLLGVGTCATWAIPQTLAGPEMVGRWVGLQNFAGNFSGAVAPILTGYILDRTGLFSWPLFITAGVAWIGTIAWTLVIGPIEQVRWDAPPATIALAAPAAPQSFRP
jgi:MFS transporter, ACS family, D-galactonate transporter